MTRILVISPSGEVYDHDCVRWYSAMTGPEQLEYYHNIGDAFVYDSSLKLLEFAEIEAVDIRAPSNADIDRYNNEFDYAFLRGSNYLHGQMDWENAPAVLSRLRIPIIAFGIGAQSPVHGPLQLSDAARRVVALIAERSVSMGVRGAYTADVLWSLGVRNIRIVGCPTAFRARDPELRIDLPPLDAVREVGFTLRREVGWDYAQDVTRYLDLQRATMLSLAGRFSLDILAQGEVEEKFVLLGTEQQRAAGLATLRAQGWLRGGDDPLEALYRSRLFYADDVTAFERKVTGKQMVLGYRLHGNLMALANRVPSIYFTYDSRTAEFCDTFCIPRFDVFDGGEFRIEDYWDQPLFERFNRAWRATWREMRLFLDENRIPHRMADETGADRRPAAVPRALAA